MKKLITCLFSLCLLVSWIIGSITTVNASSSIKPTATPPLPTGFVYLRQIDSTILQDIRYASYHNFIGHPIKGYLAAECILTRPAALALSHLQQQLRPQHLSLKVFDCYRPQQAVNEFIAWSKNSSDQLMKTEFYPRVNKKDFFVLGYVAAKSGHSRGSTIDLTIVPLPVPPADPYNPKQHTPLVNCFAPFHQRYYDSGLDMGTGFDCMDKLAHPDNQNVSKPAWQNRMLLQHLMIQNGFVPYPEEWWHFTLKTEPYKNQYFDFAIVAKN